MILKNKILLFVISILMLSSCVNLPIYKPQKITTKEEISDIRYYDKEGKILYDVYDDEKNIYVNIKTSDYTSQVKILKMGLTVWFDQKSKKNKDKGIVFPIKQGLKQNKQRNNLDNSNRLNDEEQKIQQLHNQFNLSVKRINLIGMNGDNSQKFFNSELEKSDIIAKITFDTLNRLDYLAVIPKSKIFTNDKYIDNKFSIGIESGFLDINEMRQGKPEGGGRSGGSGRPSGGKPGGGGGRPGGGKPDRAQGGNQQQFSALSEPIKVWFTINLIN